MAWRFKASKYKNAAPIVPKPEAYIRDICVGSYQTYGNNITASAQFMAFNWDYAGSSLAIFPLNDYGRKSKLLPLLNAHSDTVTDMHFSPFHDNLLATASQDSLVKIWIIPEGGLKESMCNSECHFSHKQRRVETVSFHPTSDYLIHSTSHSVLSLWDILSQKEVYLTSDHSDVIQSVSWKKDGKLVATSCKDKHVRIFDPRVEKNCTLMASSHQNIKDSRIVWLGDKDKILTTGFNSAHIRQIMLRDIRNFDNPVKSLELDCSTGILMPLFDPDTNMLFLAGKGDATILYMEVSERDPFLLEGLRHTGEQTKGACLVPKRALNVMQCEVNRILQLTGNSVIPITYQVPRKSYRDFHSDLYPETTGCNTELSPSMWLQGVDKPVAKINLDPSSRQEEGNNLVTKETFSLAKETYLKTSAVAQTNKEISDGSVIQASHQGVKHLAGKFVSSPKLNGIHDDKNLKNEINSKSVKSTNEVGDFVRHKTDDEVSVTEEIKNVNNGKDTDEFQTENVHKMVVHPKPKPRTSRTFSMCDDVISGKPVARPRTNSFTPPLNNTPGTYKEFLQPLLGPKPFTPFNARETESFDKVFSVPAVPGRKQQNGLNQHINYSSSEEINKIVAQPEELDDNTTINQISKEKEKEEIKHQDKKEEELKKISEEVDVKKFDSDNDGNCCNKNKNSVEVDGDDGGGFERMSTERKSIAERKKMYESRSVSLQETKGFGKSADSKSSGDVKGELKVKKKDESGASIVTPPKRTSTVFGCISKFRLLKGTTLHKSQHIENVRNLSRQIPGESDGFHANPKRVAVPLSGPGGKIAIFELTRTGRLPDGVIPALVHGQNVMDFCWDPFDPDRLVVVCDDGTVKGWKIPQDGLKEPVNEPEFEFSAHPDKIYFVKFHPLAKDVLVTGSYDMTVKMWDLATLKAEIILKGFTEQIFAFAWSPCGKFCATFSKDGLLRVFEPRKNTQAIREGKGPVGTRGGRVIWALNGRVLVVMGFDKVSGRQIMVFSSKDLNSPLNTITLDVSPSILIPFYDEDSSTLFVTGKGDSTIYVFEITEEAPYICPLSHHKCNTLHQGLSFLPKNCCDVAKVEFAKAYRLTNNTIEPLSFTVPRIKTDLFQDDLFPKTRVTWKPALSSSDWFAGKNISPQFINLQPKGMEKLSDSVPQDLQQENKVNSKVSVSNPNQSGLSTIYGWGVDKSEVKHQQKKIQQAISDRLEINMKLEQDDMEGVDEKEWEEE